MWFRKKQSLKREQALAAKPIRLVEPEIQPLPDGGGKLKVRLQQRKFLRWFVSLPEGASKTFELDRIGLQVWNQCDGKTSVQQIIRRLAKQYGISLREAEVATVQFLHMLVKKGLLAVAGRERDGGQAAKASG